MADDQKVYNEEGEEVGFEEFTLADGSVFRLCEGDESWDAVADGLEYLEKRRARLDELPADLADISERLSAFRRSAHQLRSAAAEIVDRVEELNGEKLRGQYADSPQQELTKAAHVFVRLITNAMGSVALWAHTSVRFAEQDLEDHHDWAKRRDEALGIRAASAQAAA